MKNTETMELGQLVNDLRKGGISIKIGDANKELADTIIRCGRGGGGGSCGGGCGQGSGSGGGGRKDIFEHEYKKVA